MVATFLRYLLGGVGLAFVLGLSMSAADARPTLGAGLAPGPYPVGFKSYWVFDASRRFSAVAEGHVIYGSSSSPRPILIEEWYPAVASDKARPMRQGDYLNIVPAGGSVRDLAKVLRDEARENIASEVIDADLASLTPQQSRALHAYLAMQSFARRDLRARRGRFPLVIYVQGFGSSFEDNTFLCEYLASHGFVVLSSAYQDEKSKMIADGELVADDINFLIRLGRSFGDVNGHEIGLVGHSGGAQNIIKYQSRGDSPASALVSLDTTEDYYYLDGFLHSSFVKQTRPENLSVPMLFAANPEAIFQLADSFTKSQRYYLTERHTDHNEFIAHGVSRVAILSKPQVAEVMTKYRILCGSILKFLNAYLRADSSALKDWPHAGAAPDFQNKIVNLENVPPGVSGPAPYSGKWPPTPRQFAALVTSNKVDAALATLVRPSNADERTPILSETFGWGLFEHLLEQKDVFHARVEVGLYRAIDPKISFVDHLQKWAKLFENLGVPNFAAHFREQIDRFNTPPPPSDGNSETQVGAEHRPFQNAGQRDSNIQLAFTLQM